MTTVAPLGSKDLPDREVPLWKLAGPGAILLGLSLGAGEMVLWPWIMARFGAGMAWAAGVGLFLQLWVNIEIGRWAIATGESPYTGFARAWIGFIHLLILIRIPTLFLPGWARVSGDALKALVFGPDGPGPSWVWTTITFALIAIILFGPKAMYGTVEKVVAVLIVVMVGGLIFVLFHVATYEALFELAGGLTNFGHVELAEDFRFPRFFGAIVFAGIGGNGNLLYAFYLRDKGIGMGARIPKLLNPLRSAASTVRETGYTYPDTPDNQRRFRDWFRFVVFDQTLFFFVLNMFTMLLLMFAALAVLRPAGVVPGPGRFLWDEALVLGTTLGPAGRYAFLLIGMAALFTTQLVVVDGNARTWAYVVNTSFSFGQRHPQSRWYLLFAILFMVTGVASTWFFEQFQVSGLGFLFNSALLSGFTMALYVPLVLYLNIAKLPASARPPLLNRVMVGIAALTYVSFAVYVVIDGLMA